MSRSVGAISLLPGPLVLLIVVLAPGVALALLLQSIVWLLYVPAGILVALLFFAALPIPRKVTPAEFADELERHLLGTAGPWDWDDVISVGIADKRLDQLRASLGRARFISLGWEDDRSELQSVIAALRRGEIPRITARVDE